MPKYIGDKPLKARYVGDRLITKIYRGASLVWGAIKEALAQISGKSMTLVNCTREESLNDFKLYGKSEQTKYQGYNLADLREIFDRYNSRQVSIGGLTFNLNDDDSVTITGTCIQQFVNISSVWTNRQDTGTITISNDSTNGEIWFGYYVSPQQSDTGMVQQYKYGKGEEQVTRSVNDYPYKKLVIGCRSVGTEVNVTIKPFVYNGTKSNKPYEPYVGGIPSPNPDYPQEISSVENPIVEVGGANLCADIEYKGYYYNDAGQLAYIGWINTTYMVEVKPTQYIYCVGDDINLYTIRFNFFDANRNFISRTAQGSGGKWNRVNVPVGTKHMCMSIDNNATWVMVSYDKFDYEPYKEPKSYTWNHTLYGIPVSSGGNYTDETGQQWIADYVDVENKKLWHRCIKEVFDENDMWKYENVNGKSNFCTPKKRLLGQLRYENAYFLNIGRANTMLVQRGDSIITSNLNFYMNDNSTLEDFKTMLSTNPIVLIGRLETPYSEDLTDAEIEAFKQLKTFKPTTIVTNNYDAHMSTSYHTRLEELDAMSISAYNETLNEIGE